MFFFILVGKVGVPKQLVVMGDPFSIPMEVQKAGLSFPIGNILVPSLFFYKIGLYFMFLFYLNIHYFFCSGKTSGY